MRIDNVSKSLRLLRMPESNTLKMPTAQHKFSCSARPAAAGLWVRPVARKILASAALRE